MLKAMSIAGTSTPIAFADFVVGHGRCGQSMNACAAAIRCKGFDVEWIDARDVLVVTDAEDGGVDVDYERSNAEPRSSCSTRLLTASGAGAGPRLIATGFIATPEGVPTTLKRNGPTTPPPSLAPCSSPNISIWTDVDGGVLGRSPQGEGGCVPEAALAQPVGSCPTGANVLHPRTTLPAMKYLSPSPSQLFQPVAPGTSICDQCDVDHRRGMNPIGHHAWRPSTSSRASRPSRTSQSSTSRAPEWWACPAPPTRCSRRCATPDATS